MTRKQLDRQDLSSVWTRKDPSLPRLWQRTGCRPRRTSLRVHLGDVLAVLAIVIAALVVAFGILGAGL